MIFHNCKAKLYLWKDHYGFISLPVIGEVLQGDTTPVKTKNKLDLLMIDYFKYKS